MSTLNRPINASTAVHILDWYIPAFVLKYSNRKVEITIFEAVKTEFNVVVLSLTTKYQWPWSPLVYGTLPFDTNSISRPGPESVSEERGKWTTYLVSSVHCLSPPEFYWRVISAIFIIGVAHLPTFTMWCLITCLGHFDYWCSTLPPTINWLVLLAILIIDVAHWLPPLTG